MAQTSGIDLDISGFPVGYFIIKSAATGRVFDVQLDEIEDGTDIILFPEKEKSIVESKFDTGSNRMVLKKLQGFEIPVPITR